MTVSRFALATRNVVRSLPLMAGLWGMALCLVAPDAGAQQVTIGGLGNDSAVCTDGSGNIVGGAGGTCAGAALTPNGNITASGAVQGGTLTSINNTNVGGNLNVTNGHVFVDEGNISVAKGTVEAQTLKSKGSTILGTDAAGGDTLTVNAHSTFNGNVDVKGTLTTTGKATLGSLAVTGTTSTNGIDNNNAGITKAGAISGATDITASGMIKGGTLTDGTATISSGNITGVGTINSTTIVNSGNTKTGSLTVDNDAGVGGNLTVTGASNLNGGANIGNHLTVAPGTTVNMGGNVVHGVADPIAGTDAANRQYVDAGLSRAFKDIDRNTQGIAIAMAMGGMALPDSKNFALGANLGFFDSKQAMAIQGAMRLTPFVSVNGGIGMGLDDSSTLGGRVGVQVAW